MSKAPELEPAWLVGLLMAWSRRTSRDSALGYPTECVYLKKRTGNSQRSYEPTGYSATEVEAVGRHVHQLRLMRRLAIMRYCKPWMVIAINQELGREFDTDTWLYHLKNGLSEIESLMDKKTLAQSDDCGYCPKS